MESESFKILKNVLVDGQSTPMWVYKLSDSDPIYEFPTLEEAQDFSATYTHPHKIVKWVNGSPVEQY